MAKGVYIGIDGKARKIKKIYVGKEETIDILDYIESTGKEFLDIDYKPNSNTVFELDMQLTNLNINNYEWEWIPMFGIRDNISGLKNSFGSFNSTTLNNAFTFIYNTTDTTNLTFNGSLLDRNIIKIDKNNYYINNTLVYSSANNNEFAAEKSITLFTVKNIDGTIDSRRACGRIYSLKISENDTLIMDLVPIKTDSGMVCLYDKISGKKFYNRGAGSFIAGETTGEKKVLKSKARKVKKGYIGIGGVARPFMSEDLITFYGTLTPTTEWKQWVGKGNIGNYAIIVGGSLNGDYSSSNMSATVEAYNTFLVKSSSTSLSQARRDIGFCSTPSHVVFAGGDPYNNGSNVVDAYNSSLVRSVATHSSKLAGICGGTVGEYAIMAGGQLWGTGKSLVHSYSSTLARSTLSSLNASVMLATSASVGNYVLIGGGSSNGSSSTDKVTAYNSSLVKSTPTSFESNKWLMGGGAINNYALFLGGSAGTTVEAYDSNLVKTTPISISTGFSDRLSNMTASNGKYVACLNRDGIIDLIDENLTKTSYKQDKYTSCISGLFINNYLIHFMCANTTEVNAYIIET